MHATKLTAGISSLVVNSIQRIAVTATIVSEQQVGTNFVNYCNLLLQKSSDSPIIPMC